MNERMILADGSVIAIEEGASLGNITHIAADEAAAVEICGLITPENLVHVEFTHDGLEEPYGVYDNLTKAAEPMRYTNEDETVTVLISLREKTDVELRLDALDESQELQNEVLDTLIME